MKRKPLKKCRACPYVNEMMAQKDYLNALVVLTHFFLPICPETRKNMVAKARESGMVLREAQYNSARREIMEEFGVSEDRRMGA